MTGYSVVYPTLWAAKNSFKPLQEPTRACGGYEQPSSIPIGSFLKSLGRMGLPKDCIYYASRVRDCGNLLATNRLRLR